MLLHNIALLTLNLGLGLCSRFQHTRDAPVVHTLNGSYYGIHDFVHNQDQFLGVPYAQPPVGALRFAHPQSLNESWPGLNNATEIGYSCVGYGLDSEYATFNYTSEDCLLLNIVRPASEVSDPLPVAVWIHGCVHHQNIGSCFKLMLMLAVEVLLQVVAQQDGTMLLSWLTDLWNCNSP